MSFDSHLVVSHVVATAIMSPSVATTSGVTVRQQTQSSSKSLNLGSGNMLLENNF